jgi:CBS-domain-containing membrane protein
MDVPTRNAARRPDAAEPFLRRALRIFLSGLGAFLAMALVFALNGISNPFLLASLGGSTVFLFGLTRTPAAQPRALLGGHFGGALIGIACYQSFGGATWVYVLSVSLTLMFMLIAGAVHPPAGANPLIMVHGQAGIDALLQPVGLSILTLALFACAWTRVVPGMVRYPVKWLDRSPPDLFGSNWDR